MRETQLPTHTTPPPHADQTDQTAEPARRASRFDERGIALQTIIIMVVLLAIAGSVAAVLFSRASDVTGELESQDVTSATIDTNAECVNHFMGDEGGAWTDATSTCVWQADDDVTRGRCVLVGGAFTTPAAGDTCTVAP